MRSLKYFSLCIFLLIISVNSTLVAGEFDINPNIETIFTGPFLWKDGKTGLRLRIVTVLSEVYLNLFIQKIEYGEENCCAKIIKTYEIDSKQLEGDYQMYSITDIKWLSYDTLQFKANSTTYVIKNLDSEYKVIRQKEENNKK